jgi:hypothetical protein
MIGDVSVYRDAIRINISSIQYKNQTNLITDKPYPPDDYNMTHLLLGLDSSLISFMPPHQLASLINGEISTSFYSYGIASKQSRMCVQVCRP